MDSSAENQKTLLNYLFQVIAEATNLCWGVPELGPFF